MVTCNELGRGNDTIVALIISVHLIADLSVVLTQLTTQNTISDTNTCAGDRYSSVRGGGENVREKPRASKVNSYSQIVWWAPHEVYTIVYIK